MVFMQKKIIFMILTVLLVLGTGCSQSGNVKVYEDTEESVISHDEKTMAAVITGIDIEHNIIGFVDCLTGGMSSLIYHGGVMISDTYGNEIGISGLSCGMVVDVDYYADTGKLVSVAVSGNTVVRKGINKFSVDMENKKATYKGTSCTMSQYVTAYDGDTKIDIMEVNTEDQVTLYLYGDKLVSVVIELGHGYVRLNNQSTYVGGMVEIGYDVIVPVTEDMLLTVREGTYMLRINKGGYSSSKEVTVARGEETKVDLQDIAIPTGTATFEVTPVDVDIYVSGNKIDGNTYTNLYGSYTIKVEADGYKTFNGSFKIDEAVNSYTIRLTKLEDDTTEDDTSTEASSEDGSGTQTTGEQQGPDSTSTTEDTTESSGGNVITVKTPVGVGVYFDGDYVGVAPVSFPKTAGTHTITLYQSGYLIKSYTIQTTDNGKDDEYSFAALTSLLDLVE